MCKIEFHQIDKYQNSFEMGFHVFLVIRKKKRRYLRLGMNLEVSGLCEGGKAETGCGILAVCLDIHGGPRFSPMNAGMQNISFCFSHSIHPILQLKQCAVISACNI